MVTTIIVLSVVTAGLLAAIYFIVKSTNTKLYNRESEHQGQLADAQRQIAAVEESLNRRLAQNKSLLETELENREAAWEAKAEEHRRALDVIRKEKTKITNQLTNTFDFSDLMSRRQILAACQELQLDGALLTNVYFSPANDGSQSKDYYSQADHLLVTTRGISVIEGKYWSMLVFDGVEPSDRLPELKPIVQNLNLNLRNGEVLHISDPDASTHRSLDTKRTDLKLSLKVQPSPHQQAKGHALRLHTLLNEKIPGAVKWIDTCVFYSYNNAKVHHTPKFKGTSIVAGRDELKKFISGSTFSKDERLDVERIVDSLRNESGDVCGFGEWREKWPSTLS